jgi:itaconate CoA-transferase
MSGLPFNGLRVVGLEQAVAAPFCSRQFADLGADVIKVERPDGGDFARGYDDALGGVSSYFALLNRGKRSIVLDLKESAGRETLGKLLASADVFVHNLAPGAVERLGFGYPELAEQNPCLIWCGISGYGPDGPYRDKRAYDILIQAESGVVSLTGSAEAPAKVGVAIADISSGLYAYSSILAALYQRERTGRGERIDIAMLECLTEWITPWIYMWHGTGQVPERSGMRHNMIVPYGAYPCADGDVNISIQNEREWVRFCERVLDSPSLAGRFPNNAARLANRQEVERLIAEHFATRSRREILQRLDSAEIANGAVNDIPEVAAHPQLAARGRWSEVDSPAGRIPALLPPHNLLHAPAAMGAVPSLGQHTDEILKELS